MPVETLFSIANTAALLAWIALIAAPRRPWLIAFLRHGLIGALSLLYAVLAFAFLFRAEGAGFGTLAAVQAIFTVPEAALAGWVHYLAFDLFVGLWIAGQADRRGINRLVQVPVLLTTFLFGPAGYLLFQALLLWPAHRDGPGQTGSGKAGAA